jgi:hypothetical protein
LVVRGIREIGPIGMRAAETVGHQIIFQLKFDLTRSTLLLSTPNANNTDQSHLATFKVLDIRWQIIRIEVEEFERIIVAEIPNRPRDVIYQVYVTLEALFLLLKACLMINTRGLLCGCLFEILGVVNTVLCTPINGILTVFALL